MRGRPVGLETLIFSHFYCSLVPSPLEGEEDGMDLRNYSDEKSRARASWNPPQVSGFKVI